MSAIAKEMFDVAQGIDSFRRVDEEHPLDIYLGKDASARTSMLLISKSVPMQIYSSHLIGITIGKRTDGAWALSFSLLDNQYQDMFFHFCDDIINSTREVKDKVQGTTFVCLRYLKWQEMLKKNSSGLLSFSEIKGLIGELVFLKEFLFDKYGKNIALQSWIGPDKADQDFVCDDSWYEIKATVSGSATIKISSIEQLDTVNDGELVVVYLDKTSYANPNRITLNGIVDEIEKSLDNGEQRQLLRDILIRQGYIHRNEYDEHGFVCTIINRYAVTQSFPALRKKDIPTAIANSNYLLSLSAIQDFLKEN